MNTIINYLSDNNSKFNPNEPTSADVVSSIRFTLPKNPNTSDVKSKRSLTMPSTILLNSNEKTDVVHGTEKKNFF